MAVWYSTTNCTYVAANQFSVTGDLTTQFPATIRVRVSCSGVWKYASVSSSSYGGVTTVVTLDASVLTNPASSCEVGGAVSGSTGSLPDHDHSASGSGGSGVTGTAPAHEISGSNVRFKKPDLSWGEWFDISGGPKGATGDQGPQGYQGDEGTGGGGAAGSAPPPLLYKDNDEVTVLAGKYYSQGYRHKGQYQVLESLTTWDVESAVDVDVTSAIVGALSSGGTGSWYSLFMTSASTFVLLPFVRVDTISESGGVTTITPALHDDGTTADNTFITANDVFNNYRLVFLGDFADTNDGTVYTISDTVSATPDEIKVASDITGVVSVTDWLQMVPPAATAACYLGTIQVSSASAIRPFIRSGWRTDWTAQVSITGNLATSAADTDVSKGIPPTASRAYLNVYVYGTSTVYIYYELYSTSSNVIDQGYFRDSDMAYNHTITQATSILMWQVSKIRNKFVKDNGGEDYAANGGTLFCCGWEE